jgi:hypothetical protein
MLPFIAEGVAHAPGHLTLYTFDLNVRHFSRRTKFIEAKLILAIRLALVNELHPGKIGQMAIFTGNEESSGNRRGRFARFVANAMNVPAAIPAIRVQLQLE